MKIEVLGTGCPNCKKLFNNVQAAVAEAGLKAEVVNTEDMDKILSYKIMTTPAIVVDGKVKASGLLLSVKEIKAVLTDSGTVEPSSNQSCGCTPVKKDKS